MRIQTLSDALEFVQSWQGASAIRRLRLFEYTLRSLKNSYASKEAIEWLEYEVLKLKLSQSIGNL